MTAAERRRKRLLYLIVIGYFFGGYLLCQWINDQRLAYWSFFLPGERDIPFVPQAIYGYLLAYVTPILLYFATPEFSHFHWSWRNFCRLSSVHFLCFLLFPVRMERPTMVAVDSASWLTHWIYAIDLPLNVFPSLHVAYPLLATFLLWRFHRRWALLFLAMTLIIMASVVLIKQHYIVDVLAAVVLTTVVYRMGRTERYPVIASAAKQSSEAHWIATPLRGSR